MALSVEVAELLELFQWLTEEESKCLPKKQVGDLEDELADIYIYLLKIAAHYGIDLNRAGIKKM